MPSLPMCMFGVTSITSALLVFFLPDTSHSQMPQTVADAKNIGKSLSWLSFLCFLSTVFVNDISHLLLQIHNCNIEISFFTFAFEEETNIYLLGMQKRYA